MWRPGFTMGVAPGGSVRLSGSEMLEAVSVPAVDGTLGTVVSCNPATWAGTRAATTASGYSTYEIKRLSVSFVPAVGTNAVGTLAMGTNFDDGAFDPCNMAALSSSNGGVAFNPYRGAKCTPRLNGLRQPKFNMDISRGDSEPFRFALTSVGVAEGSVGYVTVDYDVVLYNPSNGSSVVVNSGQASTTVMDAVVGDELEITVTSGDNPEYFIPTANFVESGTILLKAGVRYALQETATASVYLLQTLGRRLLADVAVTAAACTGYVYTRSAGVLSF